MPAVINITPPFLTFEDSDGKPLEDGIIYVGQANLNPLIEANRTAVYADVGLTVPVAQPIRTSGGYPVLNGAAARLYAGLTDYSIVVLNKKGELIFSSLSNKTKFGLIDLSTDVTGTLSYTLIKYDRVQAEINAGVVPVNYFYPPGDIRRYGAVGDSNGTTGNGTDNTAALQAAVDYAEQFGGAVFIPVGCYRFTAPIIMTGMTNKYDFGGESTLQSILFADFTSGVRVAALNLGNVSGTRAYVKFHDFMLKGVSDPNVDGIYCNFTSSLTEMEALYIWRFHNGVVLANDFYTKFVNCQVNFNTNNGIQTGYLIDGVTLAACFNIGFFGCDFSFNGANGISVTNCESLGFIQTASEGNQFCQFNLNGVEGADFSGCYSEHSPTDPGVPVAQVYILNCNGITINGLTASAFKHDGSPIILVQTSTGVDITAFRCRTTGGPFNAVAIKIDQGIGVAINSCYLSDCNALISLAGTSRVEINNTVFSGYIFPVFCAANNHKVYWNQAVAADVTASFFNATDSVDLWYQDNSKNKIEQTEAFNISVTPAELNAGGKNIILPVLASERWRILDIILYTQTPYDAGGDRNIQILDDVAPVIFATITAATLKAAASVNRWGSAAVPFPVTGDVFTPSTSNHAVKVKYQGGAANYATGTINITVVAMRTA